MYSLKEAAGYKKPIIVKVAAVHNIAAIASGIARSGADIIAIDGVRGGTGAAPTRIRDNVGIPVELALAAVDQRLRDEGIRNSVSLVAGGSIRSAADVVKAVALGADAVCTGQTVIDVGINWDSQAEKLVGDVDFEAVEPLVDAVTPVPGGVGAVTTAILARHVICAAEEAGRLVAPSLQ